MTPAKEWDVITGEKPDIAKICTTYVLPLAAAAAAAAFIGYGFIGKSYFGVRFSSVEAGLYHAIAVLIGAFVGVFLSSFIIDALAPNFGAEKDMGKSVQLVAYSYTPFWVGGLLAILPAIEVIGALAGLYGLYLLYVGLPKLKKAPEDKQMTYFVVSLLVIIGVSIILSVILQKLLIPSYGSGYGSFSL